MMSRREYARHRNCDESAVRVAIRDGRLDRSLARDSGGAVIGISDAAVADEEWSLTTMSECAPLTGPTAPKARRHGESTGEQMLAVDYHEARARRETALASLAEIELSEKRGELVQACDVAARLVTVFSHCRTKLLGVVSRARQRDPSFSVEQLQLLEDLIREALEDLSDETNRDAPDRH